MFLFSHVHWDHIQGFPFFLPAFDPEASFEILGGESLMESLREVLHRQMVPPNFPIRLQDMGATFHYVPVSSHQEVVRGDTVIRALRLNHPNPSYGYRVEYRDASLVYATDTEHPEKGIDKDLAEFSRGADLLIYDAQFTPDEYEGKKDGRPRRGWGHSTPQAGAKLAVETQVGRLVLYHHDPTHDDEKIRAMELAAQATFPRAMAAYEGLELQVGAATPCGH
jgi:phosphoribosyl 1,2-cyclic phosphodiesterase